MQPEDKLSFTNCRFKHAAMNIEAGSHSDTTLRVSDYQFNFKRCFFYDYIDRLAFALNSAEMPWFPNVSFDDILGPPFIIL